MSQSQTLPPTSGKLTRMAVVLRRSPGPTLLWPIASTHGTNAAIEDCREMPSTCAAGRDRRNGGIRCRHSVGLDRQHTLTASPGNLQWLRWYRGLKLLARVVLALVSGARPLPSELICQMLEGASGTATSVPSSLRLETKTIFLPSGDQCGSWLSAPIAVFLVSAVSPDS